MFSCNSCGVKRSYRNNNNNHCLFLSINTSWQSPIQSNNPFISSLCIPWLTFLHVCLYVTLQRDVSGRRSGSAFVSNVLVRDVTCIRTWWNVYVHNVKCIISWCDVNVYDVICIIRYSRVFLVWVRICTLPSLSLKFYFNQMRFAPIPLRRRLTVQSLMQLLLATVLGHGILIQTGQPWWNLHARCLGELRIVSLSSSWITSRIVTLEKIVVHGGTVPVNLSENFFIGQWLCFFDYLVL